MQEDQIKSLIKVWYEKGRNEQDLFSKFIFLWFCFNAWLSYRSSEESDAGMMQELAGRGACMFDLLLIYDNLMQATPTVFRTHAQTLAASSPIDDARGIRPPINIADENDFENIIWGIYRIRCNLFHGGKNAENSRDQKLVVLAGCILEKWVGGLQAQWNK